MNANLLFDFTVDKQNNTINVKREFAAPLDKVWAAWTESDILDQWWAPKPWKSETKTFDFTEGGKWLYAMVGPEGEKHWSLAEFTSINPKSSFSAHDGFCDSDGNINTEMPRSNWTNTFKTAVSDTTLVDIKIKFDELKDLEGFIEMGFKEGFTMGLRNLDDYLALWK